MEILKLLFIGMILGIANVIPGISGGTLAVVFGVYDSLISLICLNVKKIAAMWKFWLPLAAGTASGILLFSKLISRFLQHYPYAALWFFIGIIAGSLPFIASRTYRQIRNPAEQKQNTSGKKQLFFGSPAAAFAIALALMLYIKYAHGENFVNETHTAVHFALRIKLFLCSAAAAAAMIIPGISGSFLLAVFGIYDTVIHAVASLNIAVLVPVAAGAAAGVLAGASLIRFLLRKFPAQTYGAIFGLVTGSLVVLYPGLPTARELPLSLILFAAGGAASYFSSRTNAGA